MFVVQTKDFEGQKQAERLFQFLIISFALGGFAYGYHEERFSYAVISLGVGFLLSCLLVLPPWPCYRKNPLSWQPVVEPKPMSGESSVSGDSDEPQQQSESPVATRSTRRRKN